MGMVYPSSARAGRFLVLQICRLNGKRIAPPSVPHLFLACAIAFGCLCGRVTAQAPKAVQRDWQRFPAIVQAPAPVDLYALGDVHGDYDRMVELLVGAHLVAPNPSSPQAVKWIAGQDMLVCTGDMIDKSDHAMSVIALLRSLQPLAIQAGGRVIVTMGNHEAEFLAGVGSGGKTSDFADELQSAGISPADVAAGKDSIGIGRWLRDLPIAAKVGDWFFCHAGNTGALTIAELEQKTEMQLSERGFDCPMLVGEDSILESRMHPRPWWEWNGRPPELKDETNAAGSKSGDSNASAEDHLRAEVEAVGAHHLVFGHQPGKIRFSDGTVREAGSRFQKFGGLVFLIDTGMSRGVQSGRGALLKVSNGSAHGASAIYADGTVQTLVP
jgi:hypothetical protein